MDKKKYNIIYQKVAKPVYEMAMMYESSVTFVDNGLVDTEVVKAFSTLKDKLKNQLDRLKA